MDLQQSLCLWILCLAELLDLTVVLLDLKRHLCDLFDHGAECLIQSPSPFSSDLLLLKESKSVSRIVSNCSAFYELAGQAGIKEQDCLPNCLQMSDFRQFACGSDSAAYI
jgi:hypothetical protein